MDPVAGGVNADAGLPNSRWADRPSVEDIVEHLEQFFPQQSGQAGAVMNASPTTTAIPWERGELIAKGGSGRVYVARTITTGNIMAVKQYGAARAEVEVLKDLNHRNVVKYIGFEETPPTSSLFVEYVPGGSIGGLLRKFGSFDEHIVKSFAGQIIDGLAHLHSMGLVHRNVRGDNILVNLAGVCKISGFGVSTRVEQAHEQPITTGTQGSVFWMAPDLVNAGQQSDILKTDIWSVGCVALEMWTGKRPWHGQEAADVLLELHNRQAPPLPPNLTLNATAEHFRMACFAASPDERRSAEELKLHSYLELPDGWMFTDYPVVGSPITRRI